MSERSNAPGAAIGAARAAGRPRSVDRVARTTAARLARTRLPWTPDDAVPPTCPPTVGQRDGPRPIA